MSEKTTLDRATLDGWRSDADRWHRLASVNDTSGVGAMLEIACTRIATLIAAINDTRPETAAQPPERCPACLSSDSTAVRIFVSRGSYCALRHEAPNRLGSAACACTNCGAIYFPIRKV